VTAATTARRRRRRTAWRFALATLLILVAGALVAPWVGSGAPPEGPALVDERLLPPSWDHPMGTDASARDLLQRMLLGTRVSLGVAVLATTVMLLVGVAWGGIAGFAPPRLDRWMMRFVDAMMATPRLLIVLALVSVTQRMSVPVLALLLGITGWPHLSRVVRARVRELIVTDYVLAARALGTPTWRILVRHVLPGAAPSVVAAGVLAVASIIPLEAALSYYGAGIAPPTPSWGVLLQDVSAHPLDAWWLLAFPAVAIAATVLSVNVLGGQLQRHDSSGQST